MRYGRWEVVRELGRGGQGVAHLVIDSDKVDVERVLVRVRQAVVGLNAIRTAEQQRAHALELLGLLEEYFGRQNPQNCAALKVLHPEVLKDENARRRLEAEVAVLARLSHPSLIGVLDARIDQGWFVTPYYTEGTLASQLQRFVGRPAEALQVFRSLVEGVVELHRQGIVHRDIKPENIFVSSDRLVLGDFGIAYVDDAGKTRVSEKYENVGSRDWMPAWAMGMRVEDVRPSFDVFSLGKVLWALVSGRTKVRLWYFDHPEFDLVQQFPNDERMCWVNRLLAGSVREHERDVWPTAREFLEQLDEVLAILRRSGQVTSRDLPRFCRVCGYGTYDLIAREGTVGVHNLGFNPAGSELLRVFQCRNCGHVDLFRMTHNPPGWREERR